MPQNLGPWTLGIFCGVIAFLLNMDTLHYGWTLDDRVAVVENRDATGENPLGQMFRNDFVREPTKKGPHHLCVLDTPMHTLCGSTPDSQRGEL